MKRQKAMTVRRAIDFDYPRSRAGSEDSGSGREAVKESVAIRIMEEVRRRRCSNGVSAEGVLGAITKARVNMRDAETERATQTRRRRQKQSGWKRKGLSLTRLTLPAPVKSVSLIRPALL